MSPMLLLLLQTSAHAAVSDEYRDYVVSLMQNDGYTCGRVALAVQQADSGWSCSLSSLQRRITSPLSCLNVLDAACTDVGAVDADGDGYTPDAGDCDDTADTVNPGAAELCDGVDNDCDGLTDNDATDASDWYRDADGDGYGSGPAVLTACTATPALVTNASDCAPLDATIHPDADESCDGTDNDCDGDIDEDPVDGDTWYADADGDGFGDPGTPLAACDQPAGYVDDTSDCDDGDPLTFIGADEICDGRDNDCDGYDDEDAIDMGTWYPDADGDGFGDPSRPVEACDRPAAYLADGTDCDDDDDLTWPGAPELCDDIQNDCDGTWTSDAGHASLYDGAGGWTDLTATLAAGTAASPAAYTLDDGDTLYVCEGTWYTALTLDASGTVIGVGDAAAVLLDGGGTSRVVDAASSGDEVWLENLTIQNGYSASSGGGVSLRNLGSVTLITVNLLDNEAGVHGGGGYFWNLTYQYWADVYFAGNLCDGYGGGAIVANTTLFEGDGITFEGNSTVTTSAYGGGALATYGSSSTADLHDVYMYDNTSSKYAGAWEVYQGTYAIDGCEIIGNTGVSGGGGIDVGSASDLTLSNCTVSGNAGSAGGLRSQGTFTGDSVVFDANVGSGDSGALQVASGAVVSCVDCVVTNNSSSKAAVNVKSGEATFDNGYFYGNDPADLYAASTSYTFDAYVTFTCTDSSCL